MTFTVPNADEAATYPGQAQLDRVDLQIVAAAVGGTGVVSGCAVTSTGAANGSVSVAAGEVKIVETIATVPLTTTQIAANATGFLRYDLITVPTGGTPVRTAGTASATPKFPNIPANSVVLCAITVPNGHTLTSTIAAGQIIDKSILVSRLFVSEPAIDSLYIVRDGDKPGFVIRGGPAPIGGPQNLLEVDDGDLAPIFWVRSVGGIDVTDDIQTDYTVMGPTNFRVDVYGYQWRGKQCSYAFAGPPGNMLSYQDACHEVYQHTRMATVGTWTSVASTSSFTAVDLGAPPNSPTTYRAALQFTNNGTGSVWLATVGGLFAYDGVTPGDLVAAVYWMRSISSAAARSAQVRITWLTSAGAVVGSDITSGVTAIPTSGAWTKVGMAGVVAPATAAKVQMSILLAGGVNGEIHQVCGAGLMKGQNEPTFAPPFIGNGHPSGLKEEHGAIAGDRWIRTDAADTPGMREYVCATGGYPRQQVWVPFDASDIRRLFYDQTNSTTTLADVVGTTLNVVAGREVTVEVMGTYTSAALTTGLTLNWTATTATFSQFISVLEHQSSATAFAYNTITTPTSHTNTLNAYSITLPIMFRVRCQFVPSVSGTLKLRFASEVAASAVVIKRGTIMTVT